MVRAPGSARWQRWFGWSVGLAVLLQLALFATATAPGLAGTADSGFYAHAAGTLRTAGLLLNPDGSAYRFWPPLYPLLLALGGGAGGLRLLHALALGLSLVVWSRHGRWVLPRAAAMVLPWVLALSTPWLVVSKFVWGEAVFLALFAGYAAALFQGLHTRRGRWWALATALAFVLPLHRTAGFFLLGGMALGLLGERRLLPPKQRLLLLAHFLVGLLGGLAWHAYALLLAAPSVYRLNRGWAQFFSSAADYGFVLSRWLLPVRAVWRPELPVVWSLALLVVLVWLRPAMPPAEGVAAAADANGDAAARAAASPWPQRYPRVLWVATAGFLLLLIIATTFTRSAAGLHDAERYASVLFGPVLLLALLRVARPAAGRAAAPWPRWLLLGLVGLWLAYAAGRAASNALTLRKLPVFAWPSAARAPN